jgi:predicted metal-dependent phosphoesterase TrpH
MSQRPLLCELHAHTTWSDGVLSIREVVDLYGRQGFDVLCITDHVVASGDPYLLERGRAVDEATWDAYLETIFDEGERARALYDLLLVPGAELTDNQADPDHSAHALALGLCDYVHMESGLPAALAAARRQGAAIVAAHPHDDSVPAGASPARLTRRFWRELDQLRPLVDRFELFNQDSLFSWVAERGLPAVAAGDFHLDAQLASWKTLILCEKHEQAVLGRLRGSDRVYLTPFSPGETAAVRAA